MATAPANQTAFLKLIVLAIAVESRSTFIEPEVSAIRSLFLQRDVYKRQLGFRAGDITA